MRIYGVMSYIEYLVNTTLLYIRIALAMLPSAFDSVARSRHTQHDHTPSKFTSKDIILTQGGLGGRANF